MSENLDLKRKEFIFFGGRGFVWGEEISQ